MDTLINSGRVHPSVNIEFLSLSGLLISSANSWWSRACGLLGSLPLNSNQALLLPSCSLIHTCGMAYSIDVVFISSAWQVLSVHEGVKPFRLVGNAHASFCLELSDGGSKQWGIKKGQYLVLPLE